jgi:hypothetical protein
MNRLDHRKYAQPILIICALLLSCAPAFAQSSVSPQIRQSGNNRAYQTLLHATVFNLGGVGYDQGITQEEKAFKKLLTSIDSTRVFQRLISEANTEGQLYALLGLHLLAPDIFQVEAEKLRTAGGPPERIENFTVIGKGKVRVADGCVFFQQDRQAVMEQIAKGALDRDPRSNARILTF